MDKIGIVFIGMMSGNTIEERQWSHVPRVGDEIIFATGPLWRVNTVRWRESPSQMPERYAPTPFVEVYLNA